MDAQECGLMLGYACIVIFLFYIIFKVAMPLQKQEAFTPKRRKRRRDDEDDEDLGPQERLDAYRRIGSRRSDQLNIGKHRATYQDTLAQLEDNVNLAMLQMVHEGGSEIPSDEKLDKIQKLHHFKTSLKGMDDFLDYHKD
tara:strand:+ start:240 stop:659 length:420 start_codon:yes stop_codon:yes gene_type:complete